MLDQIVDRLMGIDPLVLALIAGALLVLESSLFVGLIVPGDTVVLLAGSAVTDARGFLLLVVATALGSLAGESIGYLIGHRFGDRIRASGPGQRLGPQRWARAETFFARSGGSAVLTARFAAAIHALVPVTAGTVRMPFGRFAAYCTLGSLTWSVLYGAIGVAAGASYRMYGDRLGLAGYAVLGLGVLGVAGWHLYRRRTGETSAAAPREEAVRPEPGGCGDQASDDEAVRART